MTSQLPNMSEADLASQVEDLLDRFGWRWVHSRPARTLVKGKETYRTALSGHSGYFDYTASRLNDDKQTARILFIELKSAKGQLTLDQVIWHEIVKKVPCAEVLVWRPSDPIETIAKVLQY